MNINEFIKLSLYGIKSGIDNFNETSNEVKAYYPNFIEFEIRADSLGDIVDKDTGNMQIIKVKIETTSLGRGYYLNGKFIKE